jgi:hypothetical protein
MVALRQRGKIAAFETKLLDGESGFLLLNANRLATADPGKRYLVDVVTLLDPPRPFITLSWAEQ